MKKIKINFAFLALILGLVLAFGTLETKSQSVVTLYGYTGTEWVVLTGELGGEDPDDYLCVLGGTWCKGNFDIEPEEETDTPIDDEVRAEGTVFIIE